MPVPGFFHRASTSADDEDLQTTARRARYGHVLFVLYLLLYGGFVLLNAFAPEAMSATPMAGINLAVLYGLGLIAAAIVLAVFYDWLCRPRAEASSNSEGGL